MAAVLGVAAVLAGLGLYIEVRSRLKHGWHRLAYRWLTGRAWHGREVDGDVWAWPGPWFWRLHRVKRAAIRCTVTLVILACLVAWVKFPQVTVVACLVAVAGAALSLTAVRVPGLRHRRRWVRPLHRRTAVMIGVPLAGPMRHLTVARDRSEVVIRLPQDFTTDVPGRAEIVRTVAETVGIESPEASWRLAGPAPMLTLTTSQPPPARVALADVRKAIEAAKPDELVWGIGKRGKVVTSSLAGDSPHIGLSMGSGAGKSIAIRSALAQMLFHGAIALVIDFKMISQHWAHDLPNVAIVRRPHEIHAAMLWLGAEVNRRNEVALAGADLEGNVHSVVGPRLIIAGEELNAAMKVLRAYWRQLRDLDKSLPQRSPALDAFDLVNLMGRQVLMNILYVGQRLSAKAGGGDGDIRESIGVIALGRYKASTWKMLAPDFPMPPVSLTPGRFQIVGDTVREVQGIKPTAVEARELALAGVVSPLPAGMPGGRVLVRQHVPVTGPEQPLSQSQGQPGGLVTLAQAVDDQIVSRSLGALRKASQRRGFPASKGLDGLAKLYDAVELALWDQP